MDFKTMLLLVSAIVTGSVNFTEAGCLQSKTTELEGGGNCESGLSVVQYANRQADPLDELEHPRTFVSRVGERMTIECIKGQSLSNELRDWVKSLLDRHTTLRQQEYKELGWTSDDRFLKYIEDATYILIVRSSSGNPIAFAHFRFEMDANNQFGIIFLWDLCIEGSASGHGVGEYILNTVVELATHFKMSKIVVTVFKKDAKSVRRYSKRGFRIDNQYPDHDVLLVLSKLTSLKEQEESD